MRNIRFLLGFVALMLTGLAGRAEVAKTVDCTTAGKLSTYFSNDEKTSVTQLTIPGKIDVRDFKFMRDAMPLLAVLDLGGASIAAYRGAGGTEPQIDYYENSIPGHAFYSSETGMPHPALKSIVFPERLVYIGISAFYGSNLTGTLLLPAGFEYISMYAFANCTKLTSIVVPAASFFNKSAFSNCSGLTSFICLNPTPRDDIRSAFDRIPKGIPVFVPSASVNKYKETEYWNEFTNIIGGGVSVSAVPSNMGYGRISGINNNDFYAPGEVIKLSAIPEPNFAFDCWTSNGEVISTEAELEFAANEDIRLIANFVSTDATLASLSASPGTLSPVFSPSTTSYTVDVAKKVSNITLAAKPSFAQATVEGLGSKPIEIGENTFDVVVTAQDQNTTATYTIVVNRLLSNDATLKQIVLSNDNSFPKLSADKYEYAVNVRSSDDSISISAIPNDTLATIQDTGRYALKKGENKIEIVVTAEDGVTTHTYTIIVTRPLSSDASLSSLSVVGNQFSDSFSSQTPSYRLYYYHYTDEITIEATPTDSLSTVEGAGVRKAELGDNDLYITVTAEDGTTRTYSISFTRLRNNDASLASLTVSEGTLSPSFHLDSTSYTVTVSKSVSSLTVNATPNSTLATVTGAGPRTLEMGDNSIEIAVQAESGTHTKTYTIHVVRGTPTGILPQATQSLGTYPNPTTGKVTVDVEQASGTPLLQVYSLNGELLQQVQGTEVDLSAYPEGVYVIRCGNRTAKVRKQ